MIRNLVRKWLGLPDEAPEAPKFRPNNMFSDVTDPDAMVFMIKEVENGYTVTCRNFDQKNARCQNQFGHGPGYTDKTVIVTGDDRLIEAINQLLVTRKMNFP